MKKKIMAAMAALFSMGFTACNNNEAEGNFAEDHSFDEIGWDVTAEKSVSTRGEAVTASKARLSHSENAYSPINATVSGTAALVNPLQSENAYWPM